VKFVSGLVATPFASIPRSFPSSSSARGSIPGVRS
jgi:hypothetical protein